MKKILSIINLSIIIFIITFLSCINIVNAADEECRAHSEKQGFELYKERVRCLCDKYKPEKALIDIKDKFIELKDGYYLPGIKEDHQTNMNNIYKCSMLSIQKKSYELIKNDLFKNNSNLSNKLKSKVEQKITKIKLSLNKLKCNNFNDKNSTQKLNVLKQTTYETCKYVNYLEYLREKNNIIINVIKNQKEKLKEKYNVDEVFVKEYKYNLAIEREIEHVYKVFPIAYNAYVEYENNIIIHFLLEILKEDFVILREKIHKTLNPINQVIYKISNAMRKQ